MTSSNTFTGLPAGTYLLKVKDANNCVGSTGRVISEPEAITLNNTDIKNVTCNGGTNGSFKTNVTGGIANYTFKIDASSTNSTGDFSNLVAGNYIVTVTDANNCTGYKPSEH